MNYLSETCHVPNRTESTFNNMQSNLDLYVLGADALIC